jgi:protease-4
MKAFLRSFFASLLAFIVLIIAVVGIVGSMTDKRPTIEDHSYLVVDIHGEILPYLPPSGIMGQILEGEVETLHRMLGNLEKASADKRIEGVIMKISGSNTLGLASLQEVRGAVERLREKGKPVYAFSDFLDRNAIFLASACDSIFMPPSGNLIFTGMGGAAFFIKNALEKLDIEPHIHRIRDYKSAAEMVTRTESSPEAREMRQWIMDDVWDMQMDAISKDRGISEDRLIELMEYALFVPQEAVEAGLIDGLLYWDQLAERLKQEKDEDLRTVSQADYAKIDRAKVGLEGKKTIAVVHAMGMIGGRKSRVDPLLGVVMGHETVSADLKRAREDDDVAAVIFRIESNGGEGLASDLISREVQATAAVKPVVVSMIDVAASGGYMIAYRGSKVIADPMTITGSIGSISGKFDVRGFYNKLGITFDEFEKGPNALFYSELRGFTDDQRARFEQNHWDGFNWWLREISEVRGIPMERLEELAMGRVWTGRQAKDNGLIDEVGSFQTALSTAKELAGIPADEQVTIVDYPKKKSLVEVITGGDAVTSSIRWILYRFLREELPQSLDLLATREDVLE